MFGGLRHAGASQVARRVLTLSARGGEVVREGRAGERGTFRKSGHEQSAPADAPGILLQRGATALSPGPPLSYSVRGEM
jgi:hypothetical protein